MPKITFEIPIDIKDIVQKHTEIDWDKIVSDTLWNYAKKIKLLDSIACKSKLTEKDIEALVKLMQDKEVALILQGIKEGEKKDGGK